MMQQQRDHDYRFKLVLIGNSGVGKSSLMLRYTEDEFHEDSNMPTIGVDFKLKNVECEDKLIQLQVWDTAGQDRFRAICRTYYRSAHGVVITYDITDRESFSKISSWFKEVEENGSAGVPKILIGNKKDKEADREVDYSEGKDLADHFGVTFFETSAKDMQNVDDAFMSFTKQIKSTVITKE